MVRETVYDPSVMSQKVPQTLNDSVLYTWKQFQLMIFKQNYTVQCIDGGYYSPE